jgi:hypothetical protein
MATIRKRYEQWVTPDLVYDNNEQLVVLRLKTTNGDLLELEISVPALRDLIERLNAIDRLKHHRSG